MNKHPTPWIIRDDFIHDANGEEVVRLTTPRHETRAVLLHAMETWEALKKVRDKAKTWSGLDAAADHVPELVAKIEAEIAKGKP